MFQHQALTILSILAATMSGCGAPTVAGRQVVTASGWVSYEGVPVEQGEIVFLSDDNEHRAYSAPIENGQFTIETEAGPKMVQVTAQREIPGKFEEIPGPDGAPPVKWPATEMYIPEKFNVQTELRYTVTSDGATDVEFALRP